LEAPKVEMNGISKVVGLFSELFHDMRCGAAACAWMWLIKLYSSAKQMVIFSTPRIYRAIVSSTSRTSWVLYTEA